MFVIEAEGECVHAIVDVDGANAAVTVHWDPWCMDAPERRAACATAGTVGGCMAGCVPTCMVLTSLPRALVIVAALLALSELRILAQPPFTDERDVANERPG